MDEQQLAEHEAKQKEAWFGVKRNERRQRRYSVDPKYRKRINQGNRQSYRSERSLVSQKDCSKNIGRAASFGQVRTVTVGGKTFKQPCLTVREMAEALGGYTVVSLYQWQASGQFPKPSCPCAELGNRAVYTERQANGMIAVMARHQEEKAYFNKGDVLTIKRLSDAFRDGA